MAFIDELQKENKKVIFARIQYYNPTTLAQEYIFISDMFNVCPGVLCF